MWPYVQTPLAVNLPADKDKTSGEILVSDPVDASAAPSTHECHAEYPELVLSGLFSRIRYGPRRNHCLPQSKLPKVSEADCHLHHMCLGPVWHVVADIKPFASLQHSSIGHDWVVALVQPP